MERPEERRQVRVICLVLALVTFALYFRVTGYDFVFYDDPTYVTGNPFVSRGITSSGLLWALTTGYGSNWHPLSWISGMLDVQFYGVKHAGGHHLTSVLFHIGNTLLLFLGLRRMTGAVWRSAVVAALFAWHPMHVDSVAWISERKDVLSTFFWLLTLLTYTRYARETDARTRRRYYIWTLVLFALGLMSKPMLVTLPFVLLLLDFWPLCRSAELGRGESEVIGNSEDTLKGGQRAMGVRSAEWGVDVGTWKLPWKRLVWEKIPLFALSLVSSVVTFLVQRKGGAVVKVVALPPDMRVANALLAYVGYLRKMLWPSDLAVYYPLQAIGLTAPPVLAAGGLLVVISVAAVWLARRRAYVLTGWLWFLGTLVPVIGLVQVGSQAMADRYSYMSLVGIFIVLAWGLADLFGQGRLNQPSLAWAIIAPALMACVIVTWHQIPYWKNTETLFRRDLAVVGDNSIPHISLGLYYDAEGRAEAGKKELLEALKLQPHSATVLNGLGLHFAKEGDVTKAAEYYSSAVINEPGFSDAHYNFGNVLATEGKLAEAVDQYAEALRLSPTSPDAHNNLGAVLVRLGRLPEALAQFKEALRLLPDYPEAQDQMGGVLLKLGHPDVAQLHYEEAVRLKPDFAHAHLKLGLVLAQQNYLQEAIPHFQTAVKLEPTNANAFFNLGAAYAALNRFNDAAQAFGEAVRLQPEDVDARVRLAGMQQSQGKIEAAIQSYREALRLRLDAPEAMRGLAWILATSAKPELRNGAEAVRLAERANELTGHKQLGMLSALDAAYAEAGRFDDAIKIAEQVRQQAPAQNQKEVADKAAQRLELYRAGKAFHE